MAGQARQRFTTRKQDFLMNVNDSQFRMQQEQIQGWDSFRRSKGGKGVQVKEAY